MANESLLNYVKFMRGTPQAYANLASKDEDTLYFVSVEGEKVGQLWIGDKLISMSTTEDGLTTYLSELEDVDTAGAVDKAYLGWDTESQTWIPMTLADALQYSVMVGASADNDGAVGAVPAPKAGEEGYFLRGDATWAKVETESNTQVFEITLADEQSDETAIEEATKEAILSKGDIAIVKKFIATEIKGEVEEDKYEYTSYVYNGEKWVAMDGNYNAKNVYFDQDFVFTKAIGTVTIPSSGSVEVEAEGKNLYDFFAGLFAAEDTQPDITSQPSVSSANLSKAGNYEAGTTVSDITYSASFEDGKYQYGPEPTGVTVSAWEAKDNAGSVISTSASGSIEDMVITDDTNFYLTMKATYSAGSYANTNLGNASTVRISAGSKTKNTSAIKGYRNSFYGTLADTTTELTSDVIRGLTPTKKTSVTGDTFTLTIPANARRAIIALPAGVSFTATHDEGLNAPVHSSFTKSTVSVEGANHLQAIDYDVYVAGFAGTATGENNYSVTIA